MSSCTDDAYVLLEQVYWETWFLTVMSAYALYFVGSCLQLLGCLNRCLLLLGQQIPQREIVHNILHILDPVLQSITAAAQAVVLQVEDLEASKEVLDELIDEERTLVVTKSDRVACKASLSTLSANLHVRWRSGQRTSSSTSEMRDCRYSSSVRWNSSRSLRFTGTASC